MQQLNPSEKFLFTMSQQMVQYTSTSLHQQQNMQKFYIGLTQNKINNQKYEYRNTLEQKPGSEDRKEEINLKN
tara:strand:+ start:1468 stop:1686 length:219 start_codon:yes stop_codon:yes gene_type:complete